MIAEDGVWGVSQVRRQQKTWASFVINSLYVTGSSVLVLYIVISCNIIIIKIDLLSNQRDIRFHAFISGGLDQISTPSMAAKVHFNS